MIQRTYTIETQEEFQHVLNQLPQGKALAPYCGRLALVTSSGYDRDSLVPILTVLRTRIPDIVIAGISQEPLETEPDDSPKEPAAERSLTLSFLFFTRTRLLCRDFDKEKGSMNLPDRLQQLGMESGHIAGILLLCAGASLKISSFADFLSSLLGDVPVFGLTAARRPSPGMPFPFVYGSRFIASGGIAIVFDGPNLEIETACLSGWKPVGRHMLPSLRERQDDLQTGDTLVSRMDDEPAAGIYPKYLHVECNRYFQDNICEFPLILRRGNEMFTRVPYCYDHAGELYFCGDIREGERLRFSFGDPRGMMQEAERQAEDLRQFRPEALLLLAGEPRVRFLRLYHQNETEPFHLVQDEFLYARGIAEFFVAHGKGGIHNAATVVVAMREELPASAAAGSLSSLSDDVSAPDSVSSSSAGKRQDSAAPETDSEPAPAAGQPLPINLEILRTLSPVRLSHTQGDSGIVPFTERMSAFLGAVSEDLENAAEQARQASKAKSAFLSSMSHEIRTPINAVLGMDEMILRESSESNIIQYATELRSAGNSLLGLINDVLDYSRIESGSLHLQEDEYSTARLLNDLVNLIRVRAQKKGLKLEIKADPQLPKVLFGDEIRLKQIITNLLTNAVKYTEKGTVTMTVSGHSTAPGRFLLHVSVDDTGIGIRDEDKGKLFTAFARFDEKRNRGIEGTGLGLGITQQLLNMMGTGLEVNSIYGKGSSFHFDVMQGIRDASPIGDYEIAFRASIANRQQYHEKFTAPGARILYVDDTSVNLIVLRQLLKRTRIHVDTAESGEEALRLAGTGPKCYDLVFLDYRMPQMDGKETLDRMRKIKGYARVPIICLSANSVMGVGTKFREEGFNDFLSKPVNPDALENMLVHWLPEHLVIPAKPKGEGGSSPAAGTASADRSTSAPFAEAQSLPQGTALSDASGAGNASDSAGSDGSADGLPGWLRQISALDPETGMESCGGSEGYLAALQGYADNVQRMHDEIQGFYEKEDWENYTIKVHALKSSSRLVGALSLSSLAAKLEAAGDTRGQDGSFPGLPLIRQETGNLLSSLAELGRALAPLTQNEEEEDPDETGEDDPDQDNPRSKTAGASGSSASGQTQNPGDTRPPLDPDGWADALQTLEDLGASYDYENIRGVFGMLKNYRLTPEEAKLIRALQKAASAPDWEEFGRLLQEAPQPQP